MLSQALTESGTLLMADVRATQQRKGLNASGRTAASLRIEVTEIRFRDRLRLYGSAIFRLLQNGRKPNRSGKPGREQIEGLTEWVKLRGIPVAAVWPIAINQAKRGITVPNPHNPGGVLSEPLARAVVSKRIRPLLQSAAMAEVKAQLFSGLPDHH